MAKHMTLDTRKGIAHGLECRLTFAQMATMFGRAVSTVANEVKNRMLWSNKGYGITNAVCEHFETCSKVYRNADGRKTPFKHQRKCFEVCEDFRQKVCDDLGHAPYVCNGCEKQTKCPLRKRYYVADAAQTSYRGTLTESRRGTQASDEERADMSEALLAPVKLGKQSIGMVMAAAKEKFHGFSERTVYRLVNSGLLSIGRSDLVQACSRRQRKGKSAATVTKTDAKCRVGRTYEEIRRVLVKGSSFDALTQEDVSLMLSHVNSAPRPSLDGRTPYDEFVSFHGGRGREFLEKLGIRRVNAESVVLDPILLGEKFKKEANRAILHRHGVL